MTAGRAGVGRAAGGARCRGGYRASTPGRPAVYMGPQVLYKAVLRRRVRTKRDG
jgi:hypothetical protein